ncbi:hypothetical protein [Wielerella bovis]|uniref:hypothetical protein n=1 Tax=Wielerella bovis TaxID=2917790 RepID=UPI0020184AC6|nr:hypothetical protein [Wielerella bovis]ULJ59728.1 hypothetical protein MIS44_08575 [Wielerella bovis]
MMQPAEIDLTVYRGDTTQFILNVLLDNQPVEIEPHELSMQIKVLGREVLRPEFLVAESGKIVLHFSHEATRDLQFSQAHYDLQFKRGTVVRTLCRGVFNLTGDITK